MIVLGYSGFTRDLRHGRGLASPFAHAGKSFADLFRFEHGEAPLSRFPLGFFGHDGAAALVVDGRVVAAAAEERFTRVKHSLNLAGNTLLPRRAARFCLDWAGVEPGDVDCVAHYCDFGRADVDERALRVGTRLSDDDRARLRAAYDCVYDDMLSADRVDEQAERVLGARPQRVHRVRHHVAHAASAYLPSGLDEALVLTIDGSGELESACLAARRGGQVEVLDRTYVPSSLGTLYLLITTFLGFRTLGDEYKVMGLASFGDRERYRPVFERIVRLHEGGRHTTEALGEPDLQNGLLDVLGPPRAPGDALEARHADVAAGLQSAVERAVLHMLEHARQETGLRQLCVAGGVALNCTLNGVVARSGLFDDIFVQPAAGDDGAAVGAALHAWGELTGAEPARERWQHCALGPEFSDAEIEEALRPFHSHIRAERPRDLCDAVAARLARGEVVGWFQGRMEFGPRALGQRSILADPRNVASRDRMNEVVKHRESFRPFAPAILGERAHDYFEMGCLDASPFMLFAVPVRPERRADIPAVTHVDGSARVQTVAREPCSALRDLLEAFDRQTGVPVLLNTSFNVAGEPIVCSPEDAVRCFLGAGIDALAIGGYLLTKRGPR